MGQQGRVHKMHCNCRIIREWKKDHVLPGCDTAIWQTGKDILDEHATSIIRAEKDKRLPIPFTSVITDYMHEVGEI
jgi:hypothetical protein